MERTRFVSAGKFQLRGAARRYASRITTACDVILSRAVQVLFDDISSKKKPVLVNTERRLGFAGKAGTLMESNPAGGVQALGKEQEGNAQVGDELEGVQESQGQETAEEFGRFHQKDVLKDDESAYYVEVIDDGTQWSENVEGPAECVESCTQTSRTVLHSSHTQTIDFEGSAVILQRSLAR